MPDTGDPDALSSAITCREAELARAMARFDRADTAAATNGNFMSALVFALGGALAALHPHLPLISLVLVVFGGLVTLMSMLMAALSWNPTNTRGTLAETAARLRGGLRHGFGVRRPGRVIPGRRG
jgi:Na+/pantothenate symporter